MSRILTEPRGATMIRAPLPVALEAALLPWETPGELARLHAELVDEHQPQGPTERHLVEQLALHVWRKQRVAAAERALHLAVLHDRLDSLRADSLAQRALVCEPAREGPTGSDAVHSNAEADAGELVEIEADEDRTHQALRILEQGGAGAYDQALAALDPSTEVWWQQALAGELDDDSEEDGRAWQPTAQGLQRFLETEVRTWYQTTRQQIASRPAVRRQAFGESLDPHRAAKLQAYDVRLDRQLERTLGMLLRLQDLRGPSKSMQEDRPSFGTSSTAS